MVSQSVYIVGAQVGSVTRRPSGLAFYRRAVVASPTHFVDPSERETRAIESDQELFSTVLHRISSPSFLPMEDALNIPAQ
jgi:hypothetical protein